jgi:azobenzene reductase
VTSIRQRLPQDYTLRKVNSGKRPLEKKPKTNFLMVYYELMKAILLNGSPAVNPHTGALLIHLNTLLEKEGYETEIVNLRDLALPANDPNYHDNPENHPDQKVREFVQRVKETQVVVLGSPCYHGSFSGLIKGALDHLIDEAFKGKAVGVVSHAAGVRVSMQPAQHLALVARTMEGRVSDRLIGTCKTDYS